VVGWCLQEIKTVQLEEVLNERADEEMEVSDTEEDYMATSKKKVRVDSSDDKANLAVIKVRNLVFACVCKLYFIYLFKFNICLCLQHVFYLFI
jgi:hypothetical protein